MLGPDAKPLWTCPKCGHQFVTKNLWHSCGRYELDDHFAGKDPLVRRLFDRFAGIAGRCGPVVIYAQKTRIVCQSRVRFASAMPRNNWLDCALWLWREVEHPCLHRIESFGPLGFGVHFRFTRLSEFDRSFKALMREAYQRATTGRQRSR